MSHTIARTLFALLVVFGTALIPKSALADPPAAHAVSHASAPTAAQTPSPEGVVNVNAATEDELMRLPGIGPSRAHAIVTLRERVHQFGHAEDLLRVRGIGHVGFRRMRPYVSLSGPTTLANRPGRPARAEGAAASESAETPGAGS